MILNRENLRKLPIILRGRRKKAGFTQTKLAERIGDCSNIAISRVEHGRYIPSMGVLIDWCEQLGLELVIREKRQNETTVQGLPGQAGAVPCGMPEIHRVSGGA